MPNTIPSRFKSPMQRLRLLGLSGHLIGLTALHTATLQAADGDIHSQTLSNGLRVIVKEDHRAPTAVHMVWYKAGSIDETNGTTGLAHMLEHMMFKGTKTVKAGDFSRRVAAMGGRENAFTSRDFTAYFQQIHRSKLPNVMQLEADRMHNLSISQADFAKELQVVMEERRWRTDDKPQGKVYEALMAQAFVAHPYRTPVIGWMRDLETMTLADVRGWYQRWYAPNNATVIIAGDVEPQQVLRWAQTYYGKFPAKVLPERKPQDEPVQEGIRRVAVTAPAEHAYLALAYKVPVLKEVAKEQDAYALSVLSAVLDGHEAARLPQQLVRDQQLALEVGSSYDMTQRGGNATNNTTTGLFILDATPKPPHTVAALEAQLKSQLQQIATSGLEDAELNRAKNQFISHQVFQRDSSMGQAMEIGQWVMSDLPAQGIEQQFEAVLQGIQRVTSQDIQRVIQTYLTDDRLTVATLIPQPLDVAQAKKQAQAKQARHTH